MNDFEQECRMNDFDKSFKRMQSFILIAWSVGFLFTIGVVVFLGWVVVRLLQHFGIA